MTESHAVPSSPDVQCEEVQGTNFLRQRGTVEDIKEISAKKHWADTMPRPGTKGRDGIARHSNAQEEIFLPNGTKPSPSALLLYFCTCCNFLSGKSLRVVSCTLVTPLHPAPNRMESGRALMCPEQDGWHSYGMQLCAWSRTECPHVLKVSILECSEQLARGKAPCVIAAQTSSMAGQCLNPE